MAYIQKLKTAGDFDAIIDAVETVSSFCCELSKIHTRDWSPATIVYVLQNQCVIKVAYQIKINDEYPFCTLDCS